MLRGSQKNTLNVILPLEGISIGRCPHPYCGGTLYWDSEEKAGHCFLCGRLVGRQNGRNANKTKQHFSGIMRYGNQ